MVPNDPDRPLEDSPSQRPPSRPQAPPWTASDWLNLIDRLGPYADRWLRLEEQKLLHERALEAAQSRSAWRILGILMAFLLAVIAAMSWLTYEGKVSGDALLFLVGTTAGYILALAQRHLFPETIEVSTNN